MMKTETIGTSVFSVNDTGWLCGVGIEPHGKAVIEVRRSDKNSIAHYCEFHAREEREEAIDRRDRAR